jgi:predicted alpha/beta-hydrolase family hydrolase
VACRTARELGAAAVLALSFPLHPPGKPGKSRADELLGAGVPTLVIQGGNDPFGKPEEFPQGAYDLVEVPYGDHGFAVPKRAEIGQEQALGILTDGVGNDALPASVKERQKYSHRVLTVRRRGSPPHGFDLLPEPSQHH